MYILEMHYINIGPIDRADIELMQSNGAPRPVVFVGKNGSGKSILLSNIVDCLYEIAGKEYHNVLQYQDNGGHLYYKVLNYHQIKYGKDEMFAHIKFRQDEEYEYICKQSELSKEEYCNKYNLSVSNTLKWKTDDKKIVSIPKEKVTDIFDNNIVCYFAPSRFIKPDWLGKAYRNNPSSHFSMMGRYNGELRNPIEVDSNIETVQQWLFDVLADAKIELPEDLSEVSPDKHPEILGDYLIFLTAKKNAERIFSEILREQISLRLLNRAFGETRLSIENKVDGRKIAPTLDSLSTGQLALLNIFGSIIRYADIDNVFSSSRLQDIKGLVVIDEIELHLHAELQREVLPKLIKLFPLIQFIITSHSPLFLLGMKEEFGEDGFDIYEMPTAKKISPEQFSEFEDAYKYFKETSMFQNEIREAVNARMDRTLIITEGSTDWRHMKAAITELSKNNPNMEWLSDGRFEFLEFDPPNSNSDCSIKIQMSSSELIKMAREYSKIQQPRKIVFIADRDVDNDIKELSAKDNYKDWGNNVYSLCLPVPEFRKNTPQICIEHYYQDDEIKREVILDDGIPRRIYMGMEFDKHGRGITNEKICLNPNSCGENKINIIDGKDNNKVIDKDSGSEINYALPKMIFAEKIYHKEEPFTKMDFSSFIKLFDIIKEIQDKPLC